MQLNAFFPTRDIGGDAVKVRDWAQAAEDLGYATVEVPDHVFGATARHGWMPIMAPDGEAERKLADLRGHLQAFGREAEAFGIEGWLRMHDADPQRWAEAAAGWRRLGADYVMLYPMYRIPDFDAQIETLRRFKDVAGG